MTEDNAIGGRCCRSEMSFSGIVPRGRNLGYGINRLRSGNAVYYLNTNGSWAMLMRQPYHEQGCGIEENQNLACRSCSQRGSPSVLRVGPGRTMNRSPSSPGENFARG